MNRMSGGVRGGRNNLIIFLYSIIVLLLTDL